jgi:hypothetical protein
MCLKLYSKWRGKQAVLITKPLDGARAEALRFTLRYPIPRRIYANNAARLLITFTAFAAFYLSIALQRPDILLWFGPLVFGYPHLVASYRFQQPSRMILRMKPFTYLAIITAASLAFHGLADHFQWVGELPFGAWELATGALAVMIATRRFYAVVLCGVGGLLLWKGAWAEPLQFAACALLFHNWVGFFVWIRKAKGRDRNAALIATAFFGAIHLVIFAGFADSLMPIANPKVFEATQVQNTGALLAPWSPDVLTWYRAVVLYTFGLSMHYFVWLKAIPECRGKAPVSWRRSLMLLKEDLGRGGVIFATAISILGIGIWAWNSAWGPRVYFEAALIHGWFEVMFLLAALGGAYSLSEGLAPETG